ncbi:PASTA domain-containing protein [Streptomyces sp. S3(2020)]|uniref:PASTA domain-containing protein n=1 Tax=Streptomyces sp. S3(2020) TaxID=2732044 RepID=UPI001487CCD9|nr:PASTA domain-containing protein [Streptomyces sp. S3(2020)]
MGNYVHTRTIQETGPADSADDDADSETAALPDLVGLDLQAAQDEAQAAGFYALDDQDASGQGRLQVYDRNWTVCSQEPEAGTHPTDTPVTLYAVKDDESC